MADKNSKMEFSVKESVIATPPATSKKEVKQVAKATSAPKFSAAPKVSGAPAKPEKTDVVRIPNKLGPDVVRAVLKAKAQPKGVCRSCFNDLLGLDTERDQLNGVPLKIQASWLEAIKVRIPYQKEFLDEWGQVVKELVLVNKNPSTAEDIAQLKFNESELLKAWLSLKSKQIKNAIASEFFELEINQRVNKSVTMKVKRDANQHRCTQIMNRVSRCGCSGLLYLEKGLEDYRDYEVMFTGNTEKPQPELEILPSKVEDLPKVAAQTLSQKVVRMDAVTNTAAKNAGVKMPPRVVEKGLEFPHIPYNTFAILNGMGVALNVTNPQHKTFLDKLNRLFETYKGLSPKEVLNKLLEEEPIRHVDVKSEVEIVEKFDGNVPQWVEVLLNNAKDLDETRVAILANKVSQQTASQRCYGLKEKIDILVGTSKTKTALASISFLDKLSNEANKAGQQFKSTKWVETLKGLKNEDLEWLDKRKALTRANVSLLKRHGSIKAVIQKANNLGSSKDLDMIRKDNFKTFPVLQPHVKRFLKTPTKEGVLSVQERVAVLAKKPLPTDTREIMKIMKRVSKGDTSQNDAGNKADNRPPKKGGKKSANTRKDKPKGNVDKPVTGQSGKRGSNQSGGPRLSGVDKLLALFKFLQ